MSHLIRTTYEPAMRSARMQFQSSPAVSALLAPALSPAFLELFLIQFSSLGVGLTAPVEGWLQRAGQRCEHLGLPQLGRALCKHAQHESGHHLMMIQDTHALVAHWNARRRPLLDAEELLSRSPTAGGLAYQRLHEDNIAGDTPFAQVAIEYEIELLPVQFGPLLLQAAGAALGPSVLEGLSFLREHIILDVAHTRFNEQQLERLLQKGPGYLAPLARAGGAALDAYARFLQDCAELAHAQMAAVGPPVECACPGGGA